jgi:hypothetical protein
MVIFATPDFGAGGIIFMFVLIAWAVVLAISVGGIILGTRLLRRGTSKLGWMLVLASCFLPVFCYVAPPYLFRLEYGNYPLGSYPNNKIEEGMSQDEVVAILGPPHRRYEQNGNECWQYYIDSFDIRWFGVDFGPDGRVTHTYGN